MKTENDSRTDILYSIGCVPAGIDQRVVGVTAENNPYLNEDIATEHFGITAGTLRWGYSLSYDGIGTQFHHIEDAKSLLRWLRATNNVDDRIFVLVKHIYRAGVVEETEFADPCGWNEMAAPRAD